MEIQLSRKFAPQAVDTGGMALLAALHPALRDIPSEDMHSLLTAKHEDRRKIWDKVMEIRKQS